MSKIKIVESVTGRVENVHSYADLEHHHPSKNLHEAGRVYATVDGEREEVAGDYNGHIVRTRNGNLMVSKDLILQNTDNVRNAVRVPAPASGYIGGIDARNGTVEIYDRPGGEMIARIRHMDLSNFTLKNGDQIQYGQPMGNQSGYGKGIADYYGIHTHIDYNAQYLDQFKKYVTDIDTGAITTAAYPAASPNLVRAAPVTGSVTEAPLADGVLRQGERGAEVKALQEQLIRLKFKDAQGRELTPDGDFGERTKEAVKAFQSVHHLTDDGIVGKDTFSALRQAVPGAQVPAPSVAPVVTATATGTTALSNLIGSGEGSYNSYNRGVAGDSRMPINLSDMTISEIMRRQDLPINDHDHLFAVGKFQIIPSTMEATVRNLGLNGSERFTPALQERMFSDYLVDEKRPAVKAYIVGTSAGADGLERAQFELSKEFASVANPKTGRSYFENDSGGNHSSISARQVETALDQMRTQYQANLASGLSPDAAYRALNDQGQNQTPVTSAKTHAPTATGALADGVLRHGEHGPDVKKLQEQLNALHFKDKDGNALVPDGNFGKHTKEAVAAFQRTHHLNDDGIVGKDTFAALKKAEAPAMTTQPADQSPLLSNPSHPDNKLYQQALAGMEKLPVGTFKSDQERQNAAAAVTFEAKVSGMTKIDTVALSTNGSGLFAVQGAMNDPGHNRIYVDKSQAAAQPIEKSMQQLQQDNLLLAQPAQVQDQSRRAVQI